MFVIDEVAVRVWSYTVVAVEGSMQRCWWMLPQCVRACVHTCISFVVVVVVVVVALRYRCVGVGIFRWNFFRCHARNKESGTEILALRNCMVSCESEK